MFSMWFYDWPSIQQDGFFRGWDALVVVLTLMNSVGGLLISIVIKYADNILKAYAQVGKTTDRNPSRTRQLKHKVHRTKKVLRLPFLLFLFFLQPDRLLY
ncbi:hypothetical protein OESDEN_18409 [Oesophagostomum dentatum]|uniref:Uncharacterized protein n=1 Tax=Oesophagostomum dentatum TaxID=61180 RepID=A0A0B1SEC5_OESDE|nr:hypothetical protein OESDEN_18409 [Oesophagostomum dentatum]